MAIRNTGPLSDSARSGLTFIPRIRDTCSRSARYQRYDTPCKVRGVKAMAQSDQTTASAGAVSPERDAELSASGVSISSLNDPTIHANPYPFYDRLRARGPVVWDDNAGNGGGWVVIGHAQVAAALRDPRVAAERLDMPTDF